MRRPNLGNGAKSAPAPIAIPIIRPPIEANPTMRQGWQFEDVQDHTLVQEVLMPNEARDTEIHSKPVITPTKGTIRLSTTFAMRLRLVMNSQSLFSRPCRGGFWFYQMRSFVVL